MVSSKKSTFKANIASEIIVKKELSVIVLSAR